MRRPLRDVLRSLQRVHQIGQYGDFHAVVHIEDGIVTRSLPGSIVIDHPTSVYRVNEESKAVDSRIGFSFLSGKTVHILLIVDLFGNLEVSSA